jgi:DNA-binding NarL/FixJ family response regulator
MGEPKVHVTLVIDDSNLFSAAIRQTLMHRGFEIVRAKSPQKGMALFQAHRSKIDLVAIDLVMPAAGNLDLAAELERLRPGLPILYLMGAQRSIARCSIEAHSPGAVLPAPFTEEQLIERVGGLLSIEIAARRAPEEKLWERLMAVSNPIRSGAAISPRLRTSAGGACGRSRCHAAGGQYSLLRAAHQLRGGAIRPDGAIEGRCRCAFFAYAGFGGQRTGFGGMMETWQLPALESCKKIQEP